MKPMMPALMLSVIAVFVPRFDKRSAEEAAVGGDQGLLFYAPFDAHARGLLAPYGVGLASPCAFQKTAGKVKGAAVVPESSGLPFPLHTFLSREEGSVALWLRVSFDPRESATRWLIALGRFGSVYQWKGQDYLTYALYYHHLDERHDYSCHASLKDWRPGQWRHLAITWSWPKKRRRLYVDGRLAHESPIRRIPNIVTEFRVGQHAGTVDELYVYSREIEAEEVARLLAAGQERRRAFGIAQIPPALGALERLPQAEAEAPPSFVNWSFSGAEGRENALRAEVTLHGWWRWQLGRSPYEPPAPSKWRYRRAPNQSHYGESFPVRDRAFRVISVAKLLPGARNLNGAPQWCEREFTVPAGWRGRRIVLVFDSLMKGGAVLLNGRLLGSLPEENLGADYDITDLVAWDKPNRLTVFLPGIDGEMRLVGAPSRIAIADAWLGTSWRKETCGARF